MQGALSLPIQGDTFNHKARTIFIGSEKILASLSCNSALRHSCPLSHVGARGRKRVLRDSLGGKAGLAGRALGALAGGGEQRPQEQWLQTQGGAVVNSGEAGLDPSLPEKWLVEMKVGRPCSGLCGCGTRHQIGGRCSQSQRKAKGASTLALALPVWTASWAVWAGGGAATQMIDWEPGGGGAATRTLHMRGHL